MADIHSEFSTVNSNNNIDNNNDDDDNAKLTFF